MTESARLERVLAELVGGYDGGWSLWAAALVSLERAIASSRDDGEARFLSYPQGELNRLLTRLEDALRMATLAVELQATLDVDGDLRGLDARRHHVATLLLERARETIAEREISPPGVDTSVNDY